MGTIDHLVTSGIFSLDGEDFDVDNNVWIVGDDRECVVLDCAHDHEAIIGAVGDRSLKAIVCTHAHNDHIKNESKGICRVQGCTSDAHARGICAKHGGKALWTVKGWTTNAVARRL